MDELDHCLFDAWAAVKEQLRGDPAAAARRLAISLRATQARPLRSWAVVLRAGDSRIEGGWQGWVDVDGPRDESGQYVSVLELTGEQVRDWCAPVHIPYPGVHPEEAARRFGVNVKTVHAWHRKGLVRIDRYVKHWLRPANFRGYDEPGTIGKGPRGEIRVWTQRAVDAGGEVFAGPWGNLRRELWRRIPGGPGEFRQVVRRRVKATPQGAMLARWECPWGLGDSDRTCGNVVAKLYWPMPIWTVADALGDSMLRELAEASVFPGASASGRRDAREDEAGWDGAAARDGERWPMGFRCAACAGLMYESAERTSRGGAKRTRVNQWDRFVKRLSGGALRGGDARWAEAAAEGAVDAGEDG